jgi:uncharacterized UPF0160 family protein
MRQTLERILAMLVLIGLGVILGLALSKEHRTDYYMIIAVHDGTPHADDIFSVAELRIVYPDCDVVRTRNNKKLKQADIRVDVGMKYGPPSDFDHHQLSFSLTRKDGRPYASAGLIAKHFWKEITKGNNRDVFRRVDDSLFSYIDAGDCGVPTYTRIEPYQVFDLHSVIGQFIPHASTIKHLRKPEQQAFCDAKFMQAVEFAKDIILHEVAQAHLWVKDQDMIKRAIKSSLSKDPRLIILKRHCGWGRAVAQLAPEALFVVSHDEIAHTWSLQTVPIPGQQFSSKKLLPASWAGKRGKELVEITGISDAVFCHRARFLAIAKTKEGILEMADQVLS